MQLGIISLFPEMFDAVTGYGMTRVAVERGALSLRCYNPRDFTDDRYRTVDDRPYGGGPGMVMMAPPLARCIDAACASIPGPVVYLSPQGEKLDQSLVGELAAVERLVLVCGRYEGVDERILESRIDREISIGDYVLAGGELPAMVMIDAMSRLLPGVLGNQLSAEQDSFVDGLLDYPHYTRPDMFEGQEVPSVLLGGNHAAIAAWRHARSLERTWMRRPDLVEARGLDEDEQRVVDECDRRPAKGGRDLRKKD